MELDVFENEAGAKALVVIPIEMGKWEESLNWGKGEKST